MAVVQTVQKWRRGRERLSGSCSDREELKKRQEEVEWQLFRQSRSGGEAGRG